MRSDCPRFASRPRFLAIVLASGLSGCGPSEAQREELRATLNKALTRATEFDAAWEHGVSEAALRSIVPRTGIACELSARAGDDDLNAITRYVTRVFVEQLGSANTKTPASSFDEPLFGERINAARHDQLSRVRRSSPFANSIRREVSALQDRLKKGEDRFEAELNEARSLAGQEPEWDMLVVIDEVNLPKLEAVPAVEQPEGQDATFVKGSALGRAYLYDYGSKKIRCFARITVESSDEVKALRWSSDDNNRRFVQSQLEKDLWQQILMAPSDTLESVAAKGIVRDPEQPYFYD